MSALDDIIEAKLYDTAMQVLVDGKNVKDQYVAIFFSY